MFSLNCYFYIIYIILCRVTSDAILRLLGHKKEDVNIVFLYSFAVANLVVDVVCTWLFYIRRQDVFLQPSKMNCDRKDEGTADDTSMEMYDIEDVEIVLCSDYSDDEDSGLSNNIGEGADDENQLKSKNLNMISAFTHVGGDTLRSFTVLFAAVISSTFDVNPTLADAIAAIVVSVTIVVAVLPLMYSLGISILEHKNRFFGRKNHKENYKGLKTESEDDSVHSIGVSGDLGGLVNHHKISEGDGNDGYERDDEDNFAKKVKPVNCEVIANGLSNGTEDDDVEDEITL